MAREVRIPLSDNQKKTLQFIVDYIDRRGYPPTIPEIQEGLGYRNPGYVYKILIYLEKKGYISRRKGEHRGIRLTELSESMTSSYQLSFL